MQRTGPPVGKPVAIRVQGDSLERLNVVADQVAKELAGIEGVSDITKDFQPGKDELQVIVDEQAVARAGMTVQQVALQVRTALAGTISTWVRRDGDRIALRIRLPEEDRRRVSSVANLMIPNRFGNLVPLSQVAHLEQRPGLAAVIHRDERRTITVSAAVDEKITSSQAVNAGFAPVMTRLMEQHPDTILSAGGEFEDTQESLDSLMQAFVVALGLIFLILATQFGSVTQPFVVMSAIPFGIIGVIWAFWAHGTPLSFIGMVGMIGLSGVVINDSIVLVSFLNDMKRGGMTVFEAAVEAGRRRFRAVWLTTLTTIFGLLPLVYGIGGEDKFLAPAALALGYGLMFGTVLILIFIPALYLIHDDLGRMVRWVLGKFVDLSEDDNEVEHQV
jgi:multidrug efflux pump subunit AcrB